MTPNDTPRDIPLLRPYRPTMKLIFGSVHSKIKDREIFIFEILHKKISQYYGEILATLLT